MSRGISRKKTKTTKNPTGKLKTRAVKKKTSPPICGICGAKLNTKTSKKTVSQVKKMGKTEKRPQRKYGGNLCPKCAKQAVKLKQRVASGQTKQENVDLRYKQYL